MCLECKDILACGCHTTNSRLFCCCEKLPGLHDQSCETANEPGGTTDVVLSFRKSILGYWTEASGASMWSSGTSSYLIRPLLRHVFAPLIRKNVPHEKKGEIQIFQFKK